MPAPRLFILIPALALLAGCATNHSGSPYTAASEQSRDPQRAQRLTLEAADLIQKNPTKAESLLREALAADIFHGPAHNNLGVIYLKQNKLYEAASELEWARKLMPGHPDPRVNLALTLERAGRSDDALDAYETALEVYPDYLPAIQGIARLHVRTGKHDDRTKRYLSDIAFRSDSSTWREWARKELIEMETAARP